MPLQPAKGLKQFPEVVPTSAYIALILILLPSAFMVYSIAEATNAFIQYRG